MQYLNILFFLFRRSRTKVCGFCSRFCRIHIKSTRKCLEYYFLLRYIWFVMYIDLFTRFHIIKVIDYKQFSLFGLQIYNSNYWSMRYFPKYFYIYELYSDHFQSTFIFMYCTLIKKQIVTDVYSVRTRDCRTATWGWNKRTMTWRMSLSLARSHSARNLMKFVEPLNYLIN